MPTPLPQLPPNIITRKPTHPPPFSWMFHITTTSLSNVKPTKVTILPNSTGSFTPPIPRQSHLYQMCRWAQALYACGHLSPPVRVEESICPNFPTCCYEKPGNPEKTTDHIKVSYRCRRCEPFTGHSIAGMKATEAASDMDTDGKGESGGEGDDNDGNCSAGGEEEDDFEPEDRDDVGSVAETESGASSAGSGSDFDDGYGGIDDNGAGGMEEGNKMTGIELD
ncbi:hypothetical protein FQN51_001458 [Onygenales sp. PD_10]|nr:hypothetical protein FQN51_001458 [Onygenales sp. PD_10]